MSAPDCDLRGYEFMPLFGHRLFNSDFEARASDAEFRAAVRLWWTAWQQCPAGSLPDDENALCRLAGLGRDLRKWRKIAARSLQGFCKCADGRLYHPVLSREANAAFERRKKERARKAKYRENHDNIHLGPAGQDADESRTKTGTCAGQDADEDGDFRADRTGQDRTVEEYPLTPDADAPGEPEPSVWEETSGAAPRPARWSGQWRGTRRAGSNPRSEARRRPPPPAKEPDHELWPKLRGVLSPSQFQAWISKLVVSEGDGGTTVLTAPSRFHADYVCGNFMPALTQALGQVDVRFAERRA